jgi:hypothetical protein
MDVIPLLGKGETFLLQPFCKYDEFMKPLRTYKWMSHLQSRQPIYKVVNLWHSKAIYSAFLCSTSAFTSRSSTSPVASSCTCWSMGPRAKWYLRSPTTMSHYDDFINVTFIDEYDFIFVNLFYRFMNVTYLRNRCNRWSAQCWVGLGAISPAWHEAAVAKIGFHPNDKWFRLRNLHHCICQTLHGS